jgi:4-amino-4-deoxy-L-arabinose transferase-like glycosyltransferase
VTEGGARSARAPALAAALACGVFVVHGLLRLSSLEHNYDEGVYIQQARLVLAGARPYVDFFYHQTPLYLYTLAAFAAPVPDSLIAYRAPSLLASAVAGLFVYAMARRLLPPWPAVFALILFYTAPLQYYGMLALPNAVMLCFATAGAWLLGFRRGGRSAALGAALLVLAILEKPLALPMAAAVGLATLADPTRRRDAAWAAAAALVAAAAAWLLFDRQSGGMFTELLGLQAGRFSSKSGFELMRGYPPFLERLRSHDLHSALAWNLYEHARSLLLPGPFGNLHLVLLGVFGQLWIAWRRPAAWHGHRLLITLLWALPLVFSLFVWEPSWDHYFVQYVPSLSLLGGAALQGLWEARRVQRLARATAILLVLLGTASGASHVGARTADYDRVPLPLVAGEAWLTLDPFLNFVAGTRPACDLIDPFNVYGDRSLIALSNAPAWQRFRVDPEDLLRCLEADRSIRIAVGSVRSLFVDRALADGLERLQQREPDRFARMPLDFKERNRRTRRRSLLQ